MSWRSRLARGLVAVLAGAGSTLAPPSAAAPADAPNDPLFERQWNLPLIQIPEAWAVSRGAGATVAVLDTGVAYEDYDDGRYSYRKMPGFSRTRFAPGYDFVDQDEHPNDNLGSDPARAAHGTHAAAVVAETTNEGRGTASVAPGATIMPVRVLDWDGNGEVAAIAAGIRFAADNGAQVVVMSLAGTDTGPVAEAVSYAAAKGVVLVAPSGNQGAAEIRFPASHPDVISVGAVTPDRNRAYYSNYGPGLDLVAPGGDLSRDLTGDGDPDGIRQGTFVEKLDGFCYCQKEGTSSAAPHVGGVAALLVASGLATTPAQVRHALLSSALDLGAPGPDPIFGAGLVRASDALSAAAAVAADLSLVVAPPGPPLPDGTVTATLTVGNRGPAAGTGVVLTDTLPAGATVTSATTSQGSCSTSGATVTCDLATLPAGATATVTIVATVPGELGHDATVRGNEGDGNRRDNTTRPPPEPTPEPFEPASDEGGGTGARWLVVGATLAVVVGAGASVLLVRRRRRRR
ncbi:MAG TPA: S8 family serine peptidase [Acidimicrobiales bacterium]|nr:S8 family serine peptidase [Acidimicrobiales bacterium]